MNNTQLIVRDLGKSAYVIVFNAMRAFTESRSEDTQDEFWLVEHFPVFTQGQAGKPEHILNAGSIPVVQSDRGGQVTYHGPGQIVLYPLVNLKRKKMGIKAFVSLLETAVIAVLANYKITGYTLPHAPGVYVEGEKICSLGLRLRKGCSYHGLAFNIDMDLEPFTRINPCGFTHLKMTQLRAKILKPDLKQVSEQLIQQLFSALNYSSIFKTNDF